MSWFRSKSTQGTPTPSKQEGALGAPSSYSHAPLMLHTGLSGGYLPLTGPSQNSGQGLASGHPSQRWLPRAPWRKRPEKVSITQHHHGDVYSATNTHNAPVTTIHLAHNVNVVNRAASVKEDFLLLERLPSHPDIGDHWGDYFRDSRSRELDEIWSWADNPTAEQILWIHAENQIGKSTLARRLRDEFRSKDRLAAALFFQFAGDMKSTESVIRLIGGEIGRIHEGAVTVVAEAIRRCHITPTSILLKKFVHDPVHVLQLRHPLIVILDAIEEWKPHSQFIENLALLTPYSSIIRFIVLGRSEPRDTRYNEIPIRSYALAPVPVEVMVKYLEARFDAIEWRDGRRPTPEDVLRLAGVANGLFSRMERVVSIFRKLPPSNSEECSQQIYELAGSAFSRFKNSSSLEDLEEAMLSYEVCLVFRTLGHPNRGDTLNNLAYTIRCRFVESQSAGDLEEAIRLHREALELYPLGHENWHYPCSNLAATLYDRYQSKRSVDDLHEVISLGRKWLSVCPPGHQFHFGALESLRVSLEDRFNAKGAAEDIQEAITLAEEEISICPKDHRVYATLPGDLAQYKADLARTLALSNDRADSNSG